MQKHPDADAFMRAYLTQPTDATTRLVFADWLEETGVPHNQAWANFIRLRDEASYHNAKSQKHRALSRQIEECARQVRARLTISANRFVGYPKAILQLLPAANITVRLAGFEIPHEQLECVPESIARENLLFPLDIQDRTFLLATPTPTDADLWQKLTFILNRDIVLDPDVVSVEGEPVRLTFTLNRDIVLVRADRDDVQAAIDRYYGQTETESVNSLLVDFSHPLFFSPGTAPE